MFITSHSAVLHTSYIIIRTCQSATHYYAGMIEAFLKQLEESFGPTLVSHLFGYVSVAKYGLTEPELLDVLSSDKKVHNLYYILH